MGYAPQAIIDHAALRHNLKRAKEAAKGRKVWAVIKADGYGHGMLCVADTLVEADGLAVARLDEAIGLRDAGVTQPVLVLGGCYCEDDFKKAAEASFEIVLHHGSQLDLLTKTRLKPQSLKLWIKFDTGMHRLGFEDQELSGSVAALRANPAIAALNLMTHLANADDRRDPLTKTQCALFESIDHTPFDACSIANSAGLLGHPASLADWVRPGIMLYGVSPFIDSSAAAEGLLPAMTLQSRVIAVKDCRKGERIGYGGTFTCPEAMRVAVIAIGYGDGYPRHAPSGTPVLVSGKRLPLIGRVSMDMISVDARGLPGVKVGDEAVLWGRELPVEEIAKAAGTIAYELLCGVKKRVEFLDVNRDREG
ncbi:MAG: alanine racemase [Candidatus Thiodiazotropha endolucinida]|uniref:Alanine racemase n=1 Tax=Candidatus Thiodiazotropha endolucinida TaxID=1655433 RepID=A0A7Z1AGI4_9GAMM|nr:alanine racemase [Candidatus Thiodiazotropha endolucinida]ODJ88119.1 alanine racemase [Candidatus Thiodiazotropha endolucinida]